MASTRPGTQGATHSDSERRRHRVYLTRHTEYHVRDGICVAVRDRGGSEFLQGHLVVNERVAGRVDLSHGMRTLPGEPARGDGLFFVLGQRTLVTGPVEDVRRPTRGAVASYPTLQKPS